MPDSLVPVAVGACRCFGTPHPDGDSVFLSPTIGFRGGLVAEAKVVAIANGTNDPDDVKAALLETYVIYGVKAWNLLDVAGDPIPVTHDSIEAEILSDYGRALPVGEAADGLYSAAVIDPLVARQSKLLRSMRIEKSTSRKNGSSGGRRKRSKRSSTTTSAKAPQSA